MVEGIEEGEGEGGIQDEGVATMAGEAEVP